MDGEEEDFAGLDIGEGAGVVPRRFLPLGGIPRGGRWSFRREKRKEGKEEVELGIHDVGLLSLP